jgi:hypothetical protein
MKPESIEYLNQIKAEALQRDDIKTVERINGVLYHEGHIREILDFAQGIRLAVSREACD